MINEQYDRAKRLLVEHKEGHSQLAELLIKREVIMAEDVEQIFGKRQWVSRSKEIMEDNLPNIEDMPDEVKKAEEEYRKAEAEKLKEKDKENDK